MKEPVDHILRPQLPWRTDAGITECGYDATKVAGIPRKLEIGSGTPTFGVFRSTPKNLREVSRRVVPRVLASRYCPTDNAFEILPPLVAKEGLQIAGEPTFVSAPVIVPGILKLINQRINAVHFGGVFNQFRDFAGVGLCDPLHGFVEIEIELYRAVQFTIVGHAISSL